MLRKRPNLSQYVTDRPLSAKEITCSSSANCLMPSEKLPYETIAIAAIKLIRILNKFNVKLFSEYDVTNLYLVTACSSQPLIHVHSCTHTSTFIFHLSNHKNISTRFHSARNGDNKIRVVLTFYSSDTIILFQSVIFSASSWLLKIQLLLNDKPSESEI